MSFEREEGEGYQWGMATLKWARKGAACVSLLEWSEWVEIGKLNEYKGEKWKKLSLYLFKGRKTSDEFTAEPEIGEESRDLCTFDSTEVKSQVGAWKRYSKLESKQGEIYTRERIKTFIFAKDERRRWRFRCISWLRQVEGVKFLHIYFVHGIGWVGPNNTYFKGVIKERPMLYFVVVRMKGECSIFRCISWLNEWI